MVVCVCVCVCGGGSSGGAMAVVWWVWCKKVYSMVVVFEFAS